VNAVLAIASNAFRESVRDRVLWVIVGFALLVIAGGLFLSELAIGQHGRVVRDFGLVVISVIGVVLAVFIGTALVHKEVDRRTIHAVLSKPVSRDAFVTGKFFGLALTLAVCTGTMGASLFLFGWIEGGAAHWPTLLAVAFTYGEQLLLIALAVFFSTFVSPVMGAIYLFGLWIIGNALPFFLGAARASDNLVTKYVAGGLYYGLPNLSTFNIRDLIAQGLLPTFEQTLWAAIYLAAYAAVVIWLAGRVFAGRDL